MEASLRSLQAIEQGRERELRKLHTRIDEWPNIPGEELERLPVGLGELGIVGV
jgi:hypothetical protein